jgi:hypothetical protein
MTLFEREICRKLNVARVRSEETLSITNGWRLVAKAACSLISSSAQKRRQQLGAISLISLARKCRLA